MTEVTLQSIHKDLVEVKKELVHLKTLLREDLDLAEDVVSDIEESRAHPKMVSHKEVEKEFSA
ncbi:MAG TPA: hypothetical protein VJG90_05090 [Candidatus Nanoarchaeia archaeon]|nr:hypothetical protein [Candidatus Nanoarchaeia archaeon]